MTLDLKLIRKRAVTAAWKLQFGEQAEDLAQDVLLKVVEGKGASNRASASQRMIDAIRAEYGRLGDAGTAEKQALMLTNRAFIEDKTKGGWDAKLDDFESLLKGLSRDQRIVIYLRYVWGFGVTEIGQCFGVDSTRICHIRKEALDVMRKRSVG